ncbi:MAG: DUF3392 family protein [Chitinispirillaceae bacterium]|nr:DUF3392 family protein [Chitinispirillaceae bacterium]
MSATALSYLTSFIRTYLHEISFGITAVSLMLFGPYINESIRRLVRKFHWLLRYAVFILLCTVGYTFLLQIVYLGVKHFLQTCSNPLQVAVTFGLYLLLAWVAKEQKAI